MAQEPMSSPRMRRPSASSERSTRPATSIVGADGRIVLTPTELHDGNGSYGHLSSPLYGSISQSQPQHTNASNLHHISPVRKRSLRDLIVSPSVAKVLYALCLLAAVGARASLVSLYYLLVLCYGVVQSFQSRRVTLLTIVVSFVACVCHIAIKLAYGDESRYNGAEIARLFGFYTMRTTKTYVETIGEDVFVLGCSILYYWHLLRTQRGRFREQAPLVQSHLDLFEIGDHFLNGNEFKRDRPQSMLRVLELLNSVLLALTSIAVPAVASGLLYVVFLIQLIRYTVFVRRMTMEELLARESGVKRSSSFLGPEITKLVVALSVVILIAWYCIHLDLLAQNDTVQKVALYAGFANFRNGGVRWQYYFFAVFLGLLAWISAKLHRLYTKINGTGTLSSRLSNDGITAVELGTVEADVAQSLLDQRTSLKTRDIKELLKTQSIVVRAFARDGGLLLGSAAAVVWCVSYPSYLSAPLLALAFVTIALFGVLSSSVVMWLLMAYGILLALAEYTSNLTINFWSEDYTTYGLRVFDYPFLDIGAHLLCLVFMFVAIRTQWRYQDVLRESRKRCATAGDDEVKYNDEASVDRASFATIKRLATMRSQMELGWRSAAQLWLVDAKQVIVSHLDALVLVTIIILCVAYCAVVALSTHVSFFQIGYLLLAVSLMVFYEQRRRFWRYLLLYALGACFAVFVHNIECTESVELELIGLQCYHYKLKTWGSLWPTLFSAQLLIIAQLVFQLVIYVANREEIQERLRTKDHVGQNPVFFISRLAMEIDNCFRIGGAVLCYLAFIVVAIQFESGSTRLSTNLVGAVHLSLFFIIFGNHLSGFHLAPRTSLRLKVLWSLALFIEGSILIARYVYQFDKVATYLDTHLFTLSFISAQDMGFEYHASTSGISNVFIYLLPTAILTGLCFWQLSSMMKDVKPYNFFLRGRSRTADRFRFILESLQQVVISCSATALVLVTMVNALNPMSFVGFVYVVILIVGRALSDSWKQLWLPLFWLASLSALMKYVIQLSAFNSEQIEVGSLSHSNEDSPWIGTIRLVERFYEREGKSKLWELLSGDFWVIVLCCVQRIAQYFDASSSTRRQSELNEIMRRFEEQYALFAATNSNHLYPTSSCEVDDNDDDVKERVRALQDDDNGANSGKKTVTGGEEQTDRHNDEAPRSSYTLEKRDFFISLQKFGAMYASKASVNVVMLLLTVSSFVHQDVLAIVYLVIVYSIMDASPTTVCRRWWALAWLLSCVILVMYLMMLWLPPFLNCKREETFPWRVVPDEYEKWLIMSHQHKWALLTDFVALLSVYLLRNTNQNDQKVETIAAVDDSTAAFSQTLHNENSDDKSEQSMPTSHTEVMYALLMQHNVWYYLEFFVLAYWLPLLLLLVFVCGANQGGVVSMVYLFASLFMLYRLDEARRPSNLWIHYLRTWTWAHLFSITIINAPYVYAALSNCLVGDKAANDEHCMSIANFLGVEARKVPYGLIALFVLISIQCEIVVAPIYATVYATIINEHKRAVKRRGEIMREFYRQRTEQWYAMKKDKNAAIQRLKMIVSRLVHKVEELMDIARGLHHNLPPMAPSKPIIVETSQNAVLISWEKPSNSYHKIRQYRISRQQFPSLTLLGDFSDIVEISGERLEARIEGLRPGTSYQFKVCAVSRMGEGPFSAASDPIATYSLNLDGITTAGWMKYYREKLPVSRWGFLVSWMNAKYLHRYVVIDSSHLVFYQDEERALKHRSRKQKKRLKTSFKWSDVLSLQLSTSKVQYDDVSPSLYCFELIVRHSSNRGDVKYVFQSEHSKEFNLFLSALAFAVPREALGDNIIECLKERQLPSPLDITPLRRNTVEDSTFDEIKSEWSSVTGDESTLGDPEDDDFDAKNGFAWRIPLYRLLYCYQNAGFKLETVQFEEDDMNEPSCFELMQLFIHVIRSKSASICCLVLILCFTEQADLLNMVYVLATFTFLLVENPRPIPTIWTRLLAYTVICDPPAQWDKDIYVAITGAKPGRDFYTASLSVLLFSAIYAVVLYEQLGEADASSTSVADANSRISSSSLLSGYLVLLVFVELVFIIWDRVAYVTSSLRSKVLLQYSYTIGLHLTVWILLPSNTNIYFQQRPALVVFYLFQCVYLWLGALQIRYGYLAYLGSRYNYTKENKVTALGATLFGIMMKAPFLFEMRALLDYICTTTSLSWQHWVLLEDTAAHLFSIQNAMKERLENAEILQGKQRQPIQAKLTSAGVMLLFLLVCLIGPLAMFSSINPSTTTNDVTFTLVTFGLVDEHETMYELYRNSDRKSPSCQVDLNTNSASVQCIEFHAFSNDVYSISPPRTNLLVTQLQSTQALNWTLTFAFTRPGPKSAETISATYAVTITDNHRQALVPILTELTTSSLDTENVSLIHIESLYPAVVQLTASRGVLQRSTGMQSVTITKHALKESTWWSMKPDVNSSDASSYCSSTYPFCIVAVSDKIVQGLTTLGISSYGIMAVYIFVVVTVGSAVKGFFRGKVYHIQYEELPDPDDVLELVEGIYIARKEQYVGHLKDEVRLFESLVRMLRSPETLLKVTGTNVIHIPTAKEKLD
ncbi:hypothetical protein CCR75_002851 [Bremia lactucae]|uniref:Fibronectin type-III domain-containing protein n=1 Tax=Bremia lactucae TaxID=4779 RepID=A0A976IEH1_BRELC|nr:hypothetical protein CCR75_002851 [Bremia lactucae]